MGPKYRCYISFRIRSSRDSYATGLNTAPSVPYTAALGEHQAAVNLSVAELWATTTFVFLEVHSNAYLLTVPYGTGSSG